MTTSSKVVYTRRAYDARSTRGEQTNTPRLDFDSAFQHGAWRTTHPIDVNALKLHKRVPMTHAQAEAQARLTWGLARGYTAYSVQRTLGKSIY
jgi:hypothetical protein